ncbi:uncharacterized protein LOC110250372 [Exaiptasia diaphana]|uniref:Uncharacterized protein n=1 Tax=Exaiptasia diaphana TaxID=2652724 RepID=A0A913YS98_EXADI|nr:uncharacterized protein LOC110250372 [Exaiptasia diaphana]
MISVLPAGFLTLNEAATLVTNKVELQDGLTDLMNFSFLSYNQERMAYYLNPAMRSFAIYKATQEPPTSSETDSNESNLSLTYKDATSRFVKNTFDSLLKIENDFFSTDSAIAIQKYRKQEANLREIANWLDSDRFSKDPEMKRDIIESFMKCYLINIKLMERGLLKNILRRILRFCRDEEGIDNSKNKDKKKQLYVECLTYDGVACILSCLGVPQICPIALEQAKWCFNEVLKAICSNDKKISSLSKQLKLVSKCKIMSKGAQTQFLLKYGKCLVRQGRKDDGLEFFKKGVKIRKKVFKKSKSTKDRVMVAVGYNDLASTYSYNKDSNEKAIQIRQTEVLPVYEKHLGCHPFTANAHSHSAHDYLVLGKYEEALKACEKALSYRKRSLGEHSETARSLFEMGRILREQAGQTDPGDKQSKQLEEALRYLREALKMRQNLAFTSKEMAGNHVEMAHVLRSLGREEETKEHEEKAGDCFMNVDYSYMG